MEAFPHHRITPHATVVVVRCSRQRAFTPHALVSQSDGTECIATHHSTPPLPPLPRYPLSISSPTQHCPPSSLSFSRPLT